MRDHLTAGDGKVCASKFLPAAFGHPIKADVVFHRVGASDVLVIAVDQPHDNAARLVDSARDRFEANRRIDVLGGELCSILNSTRQHFS